MSLRTGRRSQLIAAVASALFLTTSATGIAVAEYPPGSFPGPAPVGAFPTVLISRTVCAAGDLQSVSAGGSTISLEVPAGAFSECTQVTLYGVDGATIVADLLPDGYTFVTAMAIGWAPTNSPQPGAGGTPAIPLTLTISDPAIKPGASVFYTTGGGVVAASDITVNDGRALVSVAAAVGIVVATKGEQQVQGATGSPAQLPSTSTAGPSAVGDESQAGLAAIAALVLLGGVGLSGVVSARRRQRRR